MGNVFNRLQENWKRRKLRNGMAKAEIVLWSRLKNSQLGGLKFRRQHSVGPFIIDFFCPRRKLAIEVDGDSHFEDGADRYDKNRQAFIERFGIRFLRFTNTEVYENLDEVLGVISDEAKKGMG